MFFHPTFSTPSGTVQKCEEKSDKKNESGIDYLVYFLHIKRNKNTLYPALYVWYSLIIKE
jgi:hypothetical protein